MNIAQPKYHPLVLVAFLLAVFILNPVAEADLVYVTLYCGHTFAAFLVVMTCFTLIAVPLVVAARQTKAHPERWTPRPLRKIAWALAFLGLALSLAFAVTLLLK